MAEIKKRLSNSAVDKAGYAFKLKVPADLA
jgi:hypothetical protein